MGLMAAVTWRKGSVSFSVDLGAAYALILSRGIQAAKPAIVR